MCLDRIPTTGETCCFFIPREVGVKILAYLGVIGGIIEVISSSIDISNKYVSPGIGAFAIIIALVLLVLSVFLVLGVHQKNGSYIAVWIYGTLALIIINIILGIVSIFMGRISVIISALLYSALNFYFVVVVNTHRVEIDTGIPTYN